MPCQKGSQENQTNCFGCKKSTQEWDDRYSHEAMKGQGSCGLFMRMLSHFKINCDAYENAEMRFDDDFYIEKNRETRKSLYDRITCPMCGTLDNAPPLQGCELRLCTNCRMKQNKDRKKSKKGTKHESLFMSEQDQAKFSVECLIESSEAKHYQELNAFQIYKKKMGNGGSGETIVFCQICDNSPCHSQCATCNLTFCEKCLKKVHNKAFEAHRLMAPEQEGLVKCDLHPEFNLVQYCMLDEVPVCQECKVSDHMGHPLYCLQDAYQQVTRELAWSTSQIKKVKEIFDQNILKLNEIKTNGEHVETELKAKVANTFLSLHEELNKQQSLINEMIAKEKRRQMKETDELIKQTYNFTVSLERLVSYATEASEETNHAVFLQTSKKISTCLNRSMRDAAYPSEKLPGVIFGTNHLDVSQIRAQIKAIPFQFRAMKAEKFPNRKHEALDIWTLNGAEGGSEAHESTALHVTQTINCTSKGDAVSCTSKVNPSKIRPYGLLKTTSAVNIKDIPASQSSSYAQNAHSILRAHSATGISPCYTSSELPARSPLMNDNVSKELTRCSAPIFRRHPAKMAHSDKSPQLHNTYVHCPKQAELAESPPLSYSSKSDQPFDLEQNL